MPRLTNAARTRRYVALCKIDNTRESQRGSLEAISKDLRARLTEQRPTASSDEIEAQVAAIMALGMKPTAVEPVAPDTPSKKLQAHRMTEEEIRALLTQPKLTNERRQHLIRRAEAARKATIEAARKVANAASKKAHNQQQREIRKLDKAKRDRIN